MRTMPSTSPECAVPRLSVIPGEAYEAPEALVLIVRQGSVRDGRLAHWEPMLETLTVSDTASEKDQLWAINEFLRLIWTGHSDAIQTGASLEAVPS